MNRVLPHPPALPLVDDLRVLYLTLHSKAFEVMVTGEKPEEFRKPSDWMKSRLQDTQGKAKEYDLIEFRNGYGKERPWFRVVYLGYDEGAFTTRYYSNELVVETDWYIRLLLGEVLEVGNYEIANG